MPNLLIATPHVVNTARKLIAEAERSHATRDKNAGGEAFRALAAQAIAHPEGLAVCQYLAHEADDYVYNGFGSWAGFVDTMQSMAKRSVERTRRAGRVLLLLDEDQQDFIDQLEQCSGQEQIEVLAVLAGAAARAEQRTILDMSGATTSARPPAPTYAPWQVNPLKIPKWRRQIIEFTRSQTALRKEYDDLLRGAFVLAPDPHTAPTTKSTRPGHCASPRPSAWSTPSSTTSTTTCAKSPPAKPCAPARPRCTNTASSPEPDSWCSPSP